MYKQTTLVSFNGKLKVSFENHHTEGQSPNDFCILSNKKINHRNPISLQSPPLIIKSECDGIFVDEVNHQNPNDMGLFEEVGISLQNRYVHVSRNIGQTNNTPKNTEKTSVRNSSYAKKGSSQTKFRKISQNQLLLDAGQKNFRVTQCTECKFVYHAGDPSEEQAHTYNHNCEKLLYFKGWKHERIAARYANSRILQIFPNDPKPWLKRVKQLLDIINRDMGYFDITLDINSSQIYLFVTSNKVVGCLVAEPATQGRKILENSYGIDLCSEEVYVLKCGISRIWVSRKHRKQGVASLLVDCLKKKFTYGFTLSNADIGLSSPSESGKKFAEKYFGTPNFYIYGI